MFYFARKKGKPCEIIKSDDSPKMFHDGGSHVMCSRPYETRQELEETERVLAKPCVKCGGAVSAKTFDSEAIDRENQCFTCLFWSKFVGKSQYYRIGGVSYSPSADLPKGASTVGAGHGGTRFAIQPHDGDRFESSNLWCQGDVPEWFKQDLPNNAVFVPTYSRLLRDRGWKTEVSRASRAYYWLNPEGKSLSDWQSDFPDRPPESVLEEARRIGHID